MNFLTLFLTLVLTLTNIAHAKSTTKNQTLHELRSDLLIFGLSAPDKKPVLGEIVDQDTHGPLKVAQAYPEELSRPLARYLSR